MKYNEFNEKTINFSNLKNIKNPITANNKFDRIKLYQDINKNYGKPNSNDNCLNEFKIKVLDMNKNFLKYKNTNRAKNKIDSNVIKNSKKDANKEENINSNDKLDENYKNKGLYNLNIDINLCKNDIITNNLNNKYLNSSLEIEADKLDFQSNNAIGIIENKNVDIYINDNLMSFNNDINKENDFNSKTDIEINTNNNENNNNYHSNRKYTDNTTDMNWNIIRENNNSKFSTNFKFHEHITTSDFSNMTQNNKNYAYDTVNKKKGCEYLNNVIKTTSQGVNVTKENIIFENQIYDNFIQNENKKAKEENNLKIKFEEKILNKKKTNSVEFNKKISIIDTKIISSIYVPNKIVLNEELIKIKKRNFIEYKSLIKKYKSSMKKVNNQEEINPSIKDDLVPKEIIKRLDNDKQIRKIFINNNRF